MISYPIRIWIIVLETFTFQLRTWFMFFIIVCGNYPLTLKMRECWNQLQPGFPSSSLFTNELKYYLLFQIQNLESGFANSLE